MSKVLHVVPNLAPAGAERIVTNLALHHSQVDAEVLSLYPSMSSLYEELLTAAGIPIHFLDKRLGFRPSLLHKVRRVFNQVKPDIVHTHLAVDKYTMWGVYAEHIPAYVHTVHSIAEKDGGTMDRMLYRHLYAQKRLLPISISKFVATSVCELYKLSEKSVPFVYNGIDIERFSLQPIPHNGLRFIQVGRLSSEKNQETTIRAFAQVAHELSETELWLAGSGPDENRLRILAKSLGVERRVSLLGAVTDIEQKLRECDVFLMPSLWEGVPLALIEAMSAGLPLVVSDIPAFRELVCHGKNALFHAPEDEKGLSSAMLCLARDAPLRQTMCEKNRIKAQDFSVDKMVHEYEEIYLRMISS
jgi:glycosyltransferase involved in cell wall biosynthesis